MQDIFVIFRIHLKKYQLQQIIYYIIMLANIIRTLIMFPNIIRMSRTLIKDLKST